MLKLFHANVVKVDRNVVMVVHVCCKRLSPMFHLFFIHVCCKCFICLLLYVASVASECFKSRSGCCTCCNGVSAVCSKCFICFRRMLRSFHPDIAKVDRSVARRGRWLMLGRGRGPIDVGFPCVARRHESLRARVLG